MRVPKPTTASGYGLFSDATFRLSPIGISVVPRTAHRYRFAVLEGLAGEERVPGDLTSG